MFCYVCYKCSRVQFYYSYVCIKYPYWSNKNVVWLLNDLRHVIACRNTSLASQLEEITTSSYQNSIGNKVARKLTRVRRKKHGSSNTSCYWIMGNLFFVEIFWNTMHNDALIKWNKVRDLFVTLFHLILVMDNPDMSMSMYGM